MSFCRSRFVLTLRLASSCLAVCLAACVGGPGEEVGNANLPLVGQGECAALGQIDDACPADAAWRTHGKYVSCVAHYLNRRVENGDLSEEQKGALVSLAGQSEVGKVPGAPGPSFASALGDADANGVADECEGSGAGGNGAGGNGAGGNGAGGNGGNGAGGAGGNGAGGAGGNGAGGNGEGGGLMPPPDDV